MRTPDRYRLSTGWCLRESADSEKASLCFMRVEVPSLDVEYFRQRAAAERELASQSERANVAAIHDELARQYEALVNRAELRPTLRIAFPANAESSSGKHNG